MKKGNKVVFVVVLFLVVVFGVGQFFASSFAPIAPSTNQSPGTTTPATPTTEVIAYAPSVASSAPIKDGSCWTSSIAAPYRKDAWRCAVGNGISDPCFEIPSSATSSSATQNLACGVNPHSTSSTFILHLTKPLPASQALSLTPPKTWAWLVELQDGTLCSPFTGTRPFAADGESANYGCAPGPLGKEVLIFGDLTAAASSLWTANVGTLSVSTSTFPPTITSSRQVNIKTVWQ